MKELYDKIIEEVNKSAKEQNMFTLPSTDGYEKTESDFASGGATLFGKKFNITKNEEEINVTYESKDKCRTFQVRPDLNIVNVTWTKDNKTVDEFSKSWEDKM